MSTTGRRPHKLLNSIRTTLEYQCVSLRTPEMTLLKLFHTLKDMSSSSYKS